MIIILKFKLHDYKIPTTITKIVGPRMLDGVKNFMNVQNAHVNVHVAYLYNTNGLGPKLCMITTYVLDCKIILSPFYWLC
jgi:hypothetical protein